MGAMGSARTNFYNEAVQRSGYQEEAREIPRGGYLFVYEGVAEAHDGAHTTLATAPALLSLVCAFGVSTAAVALKERQEANQLLELSPQDPVAHYASGFVRYVMGQPQEALGHLEQAIQADPRYSQAFLVQGLILLQGGAREPAIRAWEQGLEASRGQDGRLEHLLRLARQGLSFEQILQTPPTG